MDAFPWRVVPLWNRVRKALYAGFLVMLLARIMAFKTGAVDVQDVVLFSAGYVQITLAELCVQCCWNVAAFATGLLFEAFVHPNSFTVWKSRLRHRVMAVAVPPAAGANGEGADMGGAAQRHGQMQPKATAMMENPMSHGTHDAAAVNVEVCMAVTAVAETGTL